MPHSGDSSCLGSEVQHIKSDSLGGPGREILHGRPLLVAQGRVKEGRGTRWLALGVQSDVTMVTTKLQNGTKTYSKATWSQMRRPKLWHMLAQTTGKD